MYKTFLLADDDADDASFFKEALLEASPGTKFHHASDGQEIIDGLRARQFGFPTIIFLDINMPGMNGWECLRTLKSDETFKHIPVFMYSTSSHERESQKALDLGATCFFTKPNRFQDLTLILKTISDASGGNLPSALHCDDLKPFKIVIAPPR